MMKIDKNITYIQRPEDKIYLRTKLLPVNLRLLESSPQYYGIVKQICNYMYIILDQRYEDYAKLKGISGANLAIPFNIIGFNGSDRKYIMINPKIIDIDFTKGQNKPFSNCGSVRLKKSISNRTRNNAIKVEWYQIVGESFEKYQKWFHLADAYTIQHEIEHNLGILITD